MKCSISLVLCLIFAICYQCLGQIRFSPGDLRIVGYNSDAPEDVKILVCKNLQAGAEIMLTDNGYIDSVSGFRPNEGVVKYVVPPGGVTAGSILSFTQFSPVTGSFALAGGGDTIILYSMYNGDQYDFIYILGYEFDNWSPAASSEESALPPGLSEGTSTALLLKPNPSDNGIYIGPKEGNLQTLAANIANSANWQLSGDLIDLSPVATGWTITDGGSGPGPAPTAQVTTQPTVAGTTGQPTTSPPTKSPTTKAPTTSEPTSSPTVVTKLPTSSPTERKIYYKPQQVSNSVPPAIAGGAITLILLSIASILYIKKHKPEKQDIVEQAIPIGKGYDISPVSSFPGSSSSNSYV